MTKLTDAQTAHERALVRQGVIQGIAAAHFVMLHHRDQQEKRGWFRAISVAISRFCTHVGSDMIEVKTCVEQATGKHVDLDRTIQIALNEIVDKTK
jgi:hypothetical protein